MSVRCVSVVLLLAAVAGLASRAAAAPAAGAEPAPPADDEIPRLIERLAHPDPLERDKAGDRLVQIGAPAREAVLAAIDSDDPERSARAAAVLTRLPWWVDSDPPQVRKLLIQYGTAASSSPGARPEAGDLEALAEQLAQLGANDAPADERRRRLAAALALRRAAAGEPNLGPAQVRATVVNQLQAIGAHLVVLRLLMEEPGDAARWQLAAALIPELLPDAARAAPRDERSRLAIAELLARLKSLTPDTKNTPALILAARAWMPSDRDKALTFLRAAVERRTSDAGWQSGIFDAYQELLDVAIARRDYADAAALLRRVVMGGYRARVSVWQPGSLFALHACAGPLPGYVTDVVALGPTLGRPNLFDRVALLYGAGGRTIPPLLALSGHACADATMADRLWAGQFLIQHRLYAAAERELQTALLPGTRVSPAGAETADDEDEVLAFSDRLRDAYAMRVHRLLAVVAAEHRGDDAAAAEHLRQVLDCQSRLGAAPAPWDVEDINAEMHWRLLRAARAAGDQNGVTKHLDELRRLPHGNADITHDVAALLTERGDPAAAAAEFEETYERLRAELNDAPGSAAAMNNLAWLCARYGQRLPEALELSTRAITIDPHNPAFLDTAAEANFRTGHIEEAMRLETYALTLRPGDKFMTEQLERFKAGKN